MGFSSIQKMDEGLNAVKNSKATTIGTITLDSYTRTAQHEKAKNAIILGEILNGYPIIDHDEEKTKEMLSKHQSTSFPIQVRHGTPLPSKIFESLVRLGIDATEGGPISYCLPYSRVPINNAIQDWEKSCKIFAASDTINHIESFGGCMLGQLCPPSLLIAIGIIECIFFKQNGIKSVSLSYAQGTNLIQDINALDVLKKLASEYLSDTHWHVVLYSYMGVFPKTTFGSYKLMRESVKLCSISNIERLIIKTPLESKRIPTIDENVASLELSSFYDNEYKESKLSSCNYINEEFDEIYGQAKFLIDLVLNESNNLNVAIENSFKKGFIDVPFCLHQNNMNKTRAIINNDGFIKWDNIGNMPFPSKLLHTNNNKLTSNSFLNMLSYMQFKYDFI